MSNSSKRRTFFSDLQQLYRNIESSTDGQASISVVDDVSVSVLLQPKHGCNAHATFTLFIKSSPNYPSQSPEVLFRTPIFHPNIDPHFGYICLSLLNDWHSCHSLLDVVKGLLYLIEHPNFDSCNNSFATLDDPSQLQKKTYRVLAGLKVNDSQFPPNESWCEWARVNNCLPTDEDETNDKDEAKKEQPYSETLKPPSEETDKGAPTKDDSNTLDEDLSWDEFSVASSETVPSFAKIRYSVASTESGAPYPLYTPCHTDIDYSSNRIILWQPSYSGASPSKSSIFYHYEVLAPSHHSSELGRRYGSLFCGTALREYQWNPEERQTTSVCPWFPYCKNESYSICSYPTQSSYYNLDEIFEPKEVPQKTLTDDFCPWSFLDGLGTRDIFSGLFFDRRRKDSKSSYHLYESDNGSENAWDLFGENNHSDHDDGGEVEGDANEAQSVAEESECEVEVYCPPEPIEEEECDNQRERQHAIVRSPSFTSDATYEHEYFYSSRMATCDNCYISSDTWNALNGKFEPQWHWVFRQTRWPMRFAPQQTVELSMQDIEIPPWRVSAGRLMSDVCQFCTRNPDTHYIALLDPTAVSPLSPVLNLVYQYKVNGERRQLVGVLWMTALDALSPFYRVPIPSCSIAPEPQEINPDSKAETTVRPTPMQLRFLAGGSLLLNLVSWLSRMEAYSAMGISRMHNYALSNPLATSVLLPMTLGCGQAPLFDVWPLWFLRRLINTFIRISAVSLRSPCESLQIFFPFSDVDEI